MRFLPTLTHRLPLFGSGEPRHAVRVRGFSFCEYGLSGSLQHTFGMLGNTFSETIDGTTYTMRNQSEGARGAVCSNGFYTFSSLQITDAFQRASSYNVYAGVGGDAEPIIQTSYFAPREKPTAGSKPSAACTLARRSWKLLITPPQGNWLPSAGMVNWCRNIPTTPWGS